MKKNPNRSPLEANGNNDRSAQTPATKEAGRSGNSNVNPRITRLPSGTEIQKHYNEEGKLAFIVRKPPGGVEIREYYNEKGKLGSIVTKHPDGTETIEVNGVEVLADTSMN